MSVFNNFVFKSSGVPLTSSAQLVNSPVGTQFNKVSSNDLYTLTAAKTLVKTQNNTGDTQSLNVAIATHEQSGALHPRNNMFTTIDPTVNDDASRGYSVGSLWVNTVNMKAYICTASTPLAAAWFDIVTSQSVDSISTPVLYVVGSPSSVNNDATASASTFVSNIPGETHAYTDWILLDASGVVLWSSLQDAANLLNIQLPRNVLRESSSYTLTARFYSTLGKSQIGLTNFVTRAVFTVFVQVAGNIPISDGISQIGLSTLLNGDPVITGGIITVYGSKTYTFTGWNGYPVTVWGPNTTWSGSTAVFTYNATSVAYTRKSVMPAAAYEHGQCTLADGRVLITGGLNNVVTYNTTGVNTITGSTYDNTYGSSITPDAYIWDPVSDTWSVSAALPVSLKQHFQVALPNGDALVCGGILISGLANHDVYSYSAVNNAWTVKTLDPFVNGMYAMSILTDGLVLATGYDSVIGSSVINMYDPVLDVWTPKPYTGVVLSGIQLTTSPSEITLYTSAGSVTYNHVTGVSRSGIINGLYNLLHVTPITISPGNIRVFTSSNAPNPRLALGQTAVVSTGPHRNGII